MTKGLYIHSEEKFKEHWEYPSTKKGRARLKDNPLSEPFDVVQYGTLGVHDKDGNFYDFYELEFINEKSGA